MIRRDFIKNAAIAAGALSLAPAEFLSAAAPAKKPSPAPLRKSIMWGTIGMEGSVLEKCKAVKAAGFDGIEPNSHMDRNEIIDAMAQTGLVASSVCNSKHWSLLLSSPDPKVRKEGIDAQIHAMMDASLYGTDAVLLVPGRVDETTSYDDCWKRSTECIKELIPAARDLKVKICIENVWNNFLLSPMEARNYVDQFNSKWVKFYFDCGNVLKFGWPEQWVKILGDRIGRIHIKEFSRTLENTQGAYKGFNVPLGDGEVNWEAVMAQVKSTYCGGWLTTEQGSSSSPEELADLCSRLERIMK